MRGLGKNDSIHSQSIEKILDRLVPDHIKEDPEMFDLGEIFLLLVSVYLHDIGRLSSSPLHHEIESYHKIRRDYAQYHLSNFEAEAIAQICAAHADEDIYPISQCDNNYGIFNLTNTGRIFNLQKLGALLRLADELDNVYPRVDGIIGQDNSIRTIIRDINPVFEKGIIEIHSNPQNWEQFYNLKKVCKYTQMRLDQVTSYLKQIKLNYYQIWLIPKSFSAPLDLTTIFLSRIEMIEVAEIILKIFIQR